MTNTIAVTDGIKGNISNCEIETILVNPWKNKATQFYQTSTYKVVNKCDNTILSEYTETWFTVFGVIISFVILLLIWFIIDTIFWDRY